MACLLSGGVPLLTQADGAVTVRDIGTVPMVGGDSSRGAPAPNRAVHRGAPVRRRASPQPPVQVRIARLHIDAPVVPVTTDRRGALGVPADPRTTGWWTDSARPGAATGSVVLDGHVDSATRGLGAFFTLGQARPGDRVVVVNARRVPVAYRVVARRAYRKTALPTTEIFAQTTAPRLVLITCGGSFDHRTGNYLDNIVIYAVPE